MLDLRNWGTVPIVYSDLRVHSDMVLRFKCMVCKNHVNVPAAWMFSSEAPTGPFQRDDLRELEDKYGDTFQPIHCGSCQADYLVQATLSETSNNAYRIKVIAVWKAPNSSHPL